MVSGFLPGEPDLLVPILLSITHRWRKNRGGALAKRSAGLDAKYSFKGNVINSRWPTFSFRQFEHLARLLKGDQAFLYKVIN